MQTLKLIASLLLSILVIIVIISNPWMVEQKYSIDFFNYHSIPIPMVIYLLASATIGAVASAISMFIGHLRLKGILREKNKRISQIEEELNSLRNLPLREGSPLGSSKNEMEIIS